MTRHKCPAPGCPMQVDSKHLMCAAHWKMVPQDVQTAVYREYHRGIRTKTHPTPEHSTAVMQAIRAVTAKLAGRFL